MKKQVKKLGELSATAICGNDISSSVLYVSALSIIYAGKYAWITLLIVAFILFLFRKIYAEVVCALPLNGGAYNALLNTTSKSLASYAATLTILSYMATSVISANEAMRYLHGLWVSEPIILSTVLLLIFFALLAILGIRESSKVAIGIFIFHLTSMVLLISFVCYYLLSSGFTTLYKNWDLPVEGSISNAIFLGFAASMLGISGFESSANYVEEQARGVFVKTLRNMWVIVSIINPLMAFLAISIIAIPEIQELHSDPLLSQMGKISGGNWLSWIISIDAVIVLSGAVLTSFVGVTGLLERMALDRILPPFFLKKNKRNSSHRIIILFLLISISVLLITQGKVEVLAGVYTISFLAVMGLFAIGNILLKVKRSKLPRQYKAKKISVFVALIGVIIALIGNITMEPSDPEMPSNFTIFLEYFIPGIIFVTIMLNRLDILQFLLSLLRTVFDPIRELFLKLHVTINRTIDKISSQEFIFFTRGDNINNLNKVILYILKNESTKKLRLVTVIEKDKTDEKKLLINLKNDVDFLNKEYPEIKIEFEVLTGKFSPELVHSLSKKWGIPINFMFIGSPGDHFPYRIEELGGVRLII
ncbi:MAG: APC family permease [Bacteroidales bacterium]|nr:APC family permease [Bacteroidales bacterium]MCF8402958.1 APC family permease [Bacteroidales bacterium]